MKKVIYTLFIIVISVSCGSHTASETNVGKKDILMSALSIEPIDVKINEGSYMGFSGMYNDSLYFFDGYFNYCYTISIDGNVGTKKCGLGRGPGEIPVKYPLEAVYNESTKNLIALSGSNDVFVLENMKSVKRVPYKMGDNAGTSYTSPNSYTLWPEIVADCDNEYVYYNGDILKCVTENTDTDFTDVNWENLTICRNQFVMANVYSDLADVIFDGDCLIYIKEDEEIDYGLGNGPELFEGGLYVYNSDDDSITSITASTSTDGSGDDDLTQEDFENMFG